jgi:hypothetical protein
VTPGGGSVVMVGYDDIWGLPEHEVEFMGKTMTLARAPSGYLAEFYSLLPPEKPGFRFVDVRGWIGETLWTDDGLHMVPENYADQAMMLSQRILGPAFGCAVLGFE